MWAFFCENEVGVCVRTFFKRLSPCSISRAIAQRGEGKEGTCKEKMHRGNILLLLLLLFVVLFLAHDNFVLAGRGGRRRKPKCEFPNVESLLLIRTEFCSLFAGEHCAVQQRGVRQRGRRTVKIKTIIQSSFNGNYLSLCLVSLLTPALLQQRHLPVPVRVL